MYKRQVLGSLKRYGKESTREQYVALKDACLSGEVGSVDQISALKKSVSGHVIPKSDRERLEMFERMLHRPPERPLFGAVPLNHTEGLEVATLHAIP